MMRTPDYDESDSDQSESEDEDGLTEPQMRQRVNGKSFVPNLHERLKDKAKPIELNSITFPDNLESSLRRLESYMANQNTRTQRIKFQFGCTKRRIPQLLESISSEIRKERVDFEVWRGALLRVANSYSNLIGTDNNGIFEKRSRIPVKKNIAGRLIKIINKVTPENIMGPWHSTLCHSKLPQAESAQNNGRLKQVFSWINTELTFRNDQKMGATADANREAQSLQM